MSDPKRWLEGGASADLHELLRAARPTPALDGGLRARLGQYVSTLGPSGRVSSSLVAAKWIAVAAVVSAATYGVKTSTAPAAVSTAPAIEVPVSTIEPAVVIP